MAKVQNMPKEMDKQPSPGRSTLSKVTAIALLGTSLVYFAWLLLVFLTTHNFVPPILVIGMVSPEKGDSHASSRRLDGTSFHGSHLDPGLPVEPSAGTGAKP